MGPQTQFPYSRMGRKIDLKRSGTVSSASCSKDLLITPSILNDFATAWAVCKWKFKPSSISTPRSLSLFTLCRVTPSIVYSCARFLDTRCITLHFCVLNGSCQELDHAVRASMSLCNPLVSSSPSEFLKSLVSSAKILMLELTMSGRSFT